MRSLIQQASYLNNHGVELLVTGNSCNAMRAFQDALAALKKCIDIDNNPMKCSPSSKHRMPIDGASLPLCESVALSELKDTQSLSYVYDHCVLIVDTAPDDNSETLSLYSAVVLFNLGLASHREGMLGHKKSFRKAFKLYNMCLQLLKESAAQKDMPATILTLIVLNNKAHIHYEELEYAELSGCLTEIGNIMTIANGIPSALSPSDREGILLNVMLLCAPIAAPAA
jgi:tetratricopeptide (TPR) repeat protein